MNFTIADEYIKSQSIYKEWGLYDNIPEDELTHDQLIKIIKGEDRCSSTSSIDHPEFTKLRNLLGDSGFIKIERGWWNGDRVLKPFTLNGVSFNVGEKFPCACAMYNKLKYGQK